MPKVNIKSDPCVCDIIGAIRIERIYVLKSSSLCSKYRRFGNSMITRHDIVATTNEKF